MISWNGLFASWKQYLLFPLSRTKLNEQKGERLGKSSKLKENTVLHFVENLRVHNFYQKTWSTIWTTPLVASMSKSLTVASPAEDLTVTYFMLYLKCCKVNQFELWMLGLKFSFFVLDLKLNLKSPSSDFNYEQQSINHFKQLPALWWDQEEFMRWESRVEN